MTGGTIRIGLLGAGYIADWHCRAVRTVPGGRVVAVCDRSRDRADALAAAHAIPAVFTDLDAMLAAGGLDAVHVLLPPPAHAATAAAVLAAGLPVYVEKPMCLTAAECDRLEGMAANGRLGVGHNFLFDPAYDRLRADIAGGLVGRVEHVTVVWAKEFGPARGGPFGTWVFRHPAHILLEVGPHPVAKLLDLAGPADRLTADALDPLAVPGGAVFYRRWLVRTRHGRATADVRLSLGGGFPEHRVEVRGTAGTATADVERGTYVLRRRTHAGDDLDRYRRTVAEGRELVRQARRNLARYALSKAKVVREGNLFGASIAAAVRQFYAAGPGQPLDPRLTAAFGGRVVRTCLAIGDAALPPTDTPVSAAVPIAVPIAGPPDVLLLGGTGFIGRAVARRLVAGGRRVRLLARDPGSVPDDLRAAGVEVVAGDLARPADLERAVRDVPAVLHLARSRAKTRDDYLKDDIGMSLAVAAAARAAGARRLVYTGTTDSYYNGRPETITEDTPLDPAIHRRNLYAWAKAETEARLLALHRECGLPVVIARPAVVVGSGGDPHHWGVGFWASPDAVRFWGSGDSPVPLVLADDVADALVRCLDTPGIDGQAFNLAADAGLTARQYVAELAAATGRWIDARPTPAWRFFAGDLAKWAVKAAVRHPGRRRPSLRDWQSRTYRARYDCSKARRVLGWQPVSDRAKMAEFGIRRPAAEWAA